jgi:hypothetical protein
MRTHVLADCRDDAILAAHGLPTYTSSKERFVWCTACGREDPAFFAKATEIREALRADKDDG